MDVNGAAVLVTGGASGLGLATSRQLIDSGAHVTILDLPISDGQLIAKKLGATFSAGDVRDAVAVDAALDRATDRAPLRALVHCAGRGGTVRVVNRDGTPGDFDLFREVADINLNGTFNALRLSAARMVAQDPVGEERGICVLTASIAAWEGQIGQMPYASSKAGIVGMTLAAARDLASRQVRVATIAPGVFDTPILSRLTDEMRGTLAAGIPHPSRLGDAEEFAGLATHIIQNPMINGETIRLDGALRMAPR